jgi:hypothetical protein
MAGHVTATATDVFNAIQKRVANQGHAFTDIQIQTLTIDIMNVVNTDAANATTHAATEIAISPVRKFAPGV